MAERVLMVALSPTMSTGLISKWEKEEGDRVESGDLLCQVETDKATMDYESMQEGTLLKILVHEGEQASIGAPIAIIGQVGEDLTELLAEVDTDMKGTTDDEETESNEDENTPISSMETIEEPIEDRVIASPLARRMAKQRGIDLNLIQGSGPRGRIIKRDILEAGAEIQKPDLGAPKTAPRISPGSTDEVIHVTTKRKIIAERLAESKYSAPHYYLRLKVLSDDFMQARKVLNNTLKEKVSVNAFIIKFVAEAIKRHPIMNSTWQGETILRHGSIDIGLAVAQDDGLITPVVRDCGNKGIIDIDRELKDLIDKALNNQLTPSEYTGATFTISNLGSFGIGEFTAIINPPGSAILAIGKMGKEPIIAEGDKIEIRSLMTLTLSCDHRVIDGAVGAAFLKELKDIMENPIRVLY
ncbi:MAG: 2-oxo acid dehydrogenase subunit E2 [Clostridiales bacterium]|jgi:pyruvate dehydrogenase E2 component (dihydrolipoamide acetyltransferase)|nr:2-oxo acid dehydrogenase subunit E2 [Clostridiales bacterium]